MRCFVMFICVCILSSLRIVQCNNGCAGQNNTKNETWATNYSGDLYSVTVTLSTGFEPFWLAKADGHSDWNVVCSPSGQFSASCTEKLNSCWSTTLSVTNLSSPSNQIKILLNHDGGNFIRNLFVTDCSTGIIPPHGPNVTSLSQTPPGFKATGLFQCSSGSILYNSSTNNVANSATTTCLADATWDGESTAECWSAPTTTLEGPTDLKANNTINYNCTLSGGYPGATGTIFYLDGAKYNQTNKVNVSVVLTFTKEANGKNLTCQALTEFTTQNASLGISSGLTLNVTYPPRNVSATVHTPGVKSGSIYLFRSNESVTIKCSSDGNPDPSCSWNTPVVPHQCQTSGMFNTSANLTCVACNGGCKTSSNTLQIISVNAQRKAQILVNPSQFENSQKVNLSEGQKVTLECKVENSDKLNTTFSWNKNGVSNGTRPTLVLSNVSWDSSANYTCHTNDSFGSLASTITLDVQFSPTTITPTKKCELTANPCEIFFNSNPEPTSATLTGPSVAAPGKNVFVNITPYNAGSPSEYIFTYKFTSIGDYQLKVVNSIGSGTIQIPVTAVAPSPTASNIGIIIGASGAGVVVIVLIVLLVVCKRRKSSKGEY